MRRRLLPYNLARAHILDGDLLSYRPRWWSPIEQAIAIVGRSPACHSAIAGWDSGTGKPRLEAISMRVGGGRRNWLSTEVARYPRLIDVYRPAQRIDLAEWDRVTESFGTVIHQWDGVAAAQMARGFVDVEYGWFNVLLLAARFLPIVRLFARPPQHDLQANVRDPFCSELYNYVSRRVFIDLVRGAADRDVTPGDLTRSGVMNYLFTLEAADFMAEHAAEYL